MKTFAQLWSSWYTISIFALQLWTNEDMRLIYFPTRKSGPKITLIQFAESFNKLKENAGKQIAIRCEMISFVQKWKKYVIIDSYDNFFQRWRQEFEIRRSCFACGNFQYQNISIWMKLLWRNNEFVCKVFDWWITPSPSCSNSYFFFFALALSRISSCECRPYHRHALSLRLSHEALCKNGNLLQYFCIKPIQHDERDGRGSSIIYDCAAFFLVFHNIYFSSHTRWVLSIWSSAAHILKRIIIKKSGKSSFTFSLVSRND